MYGFSDPTIKQLIVELPNAEKCTSYVLKDFGENNGNNANNQSDEEHDQDDVDSDEDSDD